MKFRCPQCDGYVHDIRRGSKTLETHGMTGEWIIWRCDQKECGFETYASESGIKFQSELKHGS